MTRFQKMLAAVVVLGLAASCATTSAVTLASDEPVAAWGAGAGPAHPDQAPGTQLEPENQPPPGGWPSLWAISFGDPRSATVRLTVSRAAFPHVRL